MTPSTKAGYLLALLLALAAAPSARAATGEDDGDDEAEPPTRWSLAFAGVMDKEDNRGFDLAAGVALTPATTLRVSGGSVDYTQNNPGGFLAQGLELGADHRVGRWTLEAALGRWQDTDILAAKELKLGAALAGGAWTAGINGLVRRSTFDTVAADTTFTLADGTPLPVEANASCTLMNTGLGLHLGYQGDRFGAYARGMDFSYRTASCGYDQPGLAAATHPTTAEFEVLEAPLLAQLAAVGPRRIGFEYTLLASEYGAGASWRHASLGFSLDYAHQVEAFSEVSSETLSTTVSAELGAPGSRDGIDMTLGVTRGTGVQGGAFLGFGVHSHF